MKWRVTKIDPCTLSGFSFEYSSYAALKYCIQYINWTSPCVVMHDVVPSNFFMVLIPSFSTLGSFNFSSKSFSTYGHNIVVSASGGKQFACRSNFQAPSVRVWIFLSTMAHWWWDPTPQNGIVWLASSISDLKGCSENLPLSAWYL